MCDTKRIDCVSHIKQFYSQKSLLITGCTGFVGKVVLEKILHSCDDVGKIYVLIRRKNGFSSESRVKKLLSSAPFTARNLKSSQLEKVIAIDGNIEEENLGISDKSRQMLIDNVNIVIHVAASVRFNASFRESDDEKLEKLSTELFEGRPNSYVYTKAVAEHVVAENLKNIPTAIIRPPIVTPSIEEPVPGWVDTLNGPAGLLMAASIGVLRTSDWRYDIEPDGMPVDLISNAILSIGWYISMQSKPLGIYNITWRNLNTSFAYPDGHILFKLAIDAYLKAPYSLAFRPVFQPEKFNLKSKLRYTLEKFFYHFIVAFLIDTFISCFGYKRMLVNYVKRLHYALDIMKYFGTRQWIIKCDNTLQVLDSMNEVDRKIFEFDGRSYTEMSYIADAFWMGARRYLLKDDDSTITIAKLKYVMVLVAYNTFYAIMFYFLLLLLAKLLIPFGLTLTFDTVVTISAIFGIAKLSKGLIEDVPRLLKNMTPFRRCF